MMKIYDLSVEQYVITQAGSQNVPKIKEDRAILIQNSSLILINHMILGL